MKRVFTTSLLVGLLLTVACDLKTPPPTRDIPLGAPDQLHAEIANGGVLLIWNRVTSPSLVGYAVYRKIDGGAFSRIAQTGPDTTYTDKTVPNGHRYEYYVVARDATGEGDAGGVAKAVVNSAPVFVIGVQSDTTTATRNVSLTILAFGALRMRLSNRADLAGAKWEQFASVKAWLLESGTGTKTVYMRLVYEGGDTSGVVSDQIEPIPVTNVSLRINNGAATTTRRRVTLRLAGDDITEMAISNAPLDTVASWRLFRDTLLWDLTTGAGTKTVSAKFRNDFLMEENSRAQIDPAPLSPSVVVNGDAAMTTTRRVTLRLAATGATEMQLANAPLQLGPLWLPYRDTLAWELATGAGTKSVYAKLRNDFLIEADAGDQIDPAPLNSSVVINGGAATTPTRRVNLRLAATGATEMQVSNSPIRAGGTWQAYRDSLLWDLEMGSGTRTVYVRFRNDFLIEADGSDQIEPSPLQLAVVINDGAATTPSRRVTLRLSAAGAAQMQVANTPSFAGVSWQPFRETLAWDLATGSGTKTVYVKVRDGDFWGDVVAGDQIDPTPLNPTLVINGDAAVTSTRRVTLHLSATGATEMKLANTPIQSGGSWQPYRDSLAWDLMTGAGAKMVFARLRNDFLIESETSDVIDPTPLTTAIVINGGAATTPTRRVMLVLSAMDATEMQISNAPIPPAGTWQAFRDSLDWDLTTGAGTKTVFARLRNDFLIESETSDIIDPAPLTPAVVINDDAATTPTRQVTLHLSATGATEMKIANAPIQPGGSWQPFRASLPWDLETGAGTKLAFARFRNDFLIEADAVDEIEPRPPEAPSIVINNGAATTPTRRVTLHLSATGAIEMKVANAPILSVGSWQPFRASLPWDLETGAGTKLAFARFRNDFLIEVDVRAVIDPALMNASVVINDGAATTPSRRVMLRLSATGATEMKLSNSPSFGAAWQAVRDTLTWDLAAGPGTKSVYAKFRNDFLIEAESSDQIDPTPLTPNFRIEPDSLFINHRAVILTMPGVGATQMKIGNAADSSLVPWQPYVERLTWQLAEGDGRKIVRAWFMNDVYAVGPARDTVNLDTRAQIASLDWSTTGGDPLIPGDEVTFTLRTADDAFGDETGGRAMVAVEGWTPIELNDQGNGQYVGGYGVTVATPAVSAARVTGLFTDRAGNVAAPVASEGRISVRLEFAFPLGTTLDSILMVWIPPGEFEMGSPDDEQEREEDEGPRHRVAFQGGFWMGKYEVTQRQWRLVMGSNPASRFGVGDDYPVYFVSWEDIQEFEGALDDQFRLPSEAEWEYACRAGATTRFFWGDDSNSGQIADYAWYLDNSGGMTHPIGRKRPNAWGLCDMAGNVWEWCEDWHHGSYDDAPADGGAWLVPVGSERILRGGSKSNIPKHCRSAYRHELAPRQPDSSVGFRLVRSEP